ncbi:hypothetical protein Q8A73_021694 [Channa argus]|nr:hypothetical protein Q8A73_021694 [Channa argus]
METGLRVLCSQEPSSWSRNLTWVEYAHNTLPSASTGLTPFQVVFGYLPPLFEVHELTSSVPSAQASVRPCRLAWRKARATLVQTSDSNKRSADRRRSHAPHYRVGQRVWLSAADIPVHVESWKLAPRFICPFPIANVISPVAVRLSLPRSLRIHPTFHVSRIKPVVSSDLVPAPDPHCPPSSSTLSPVHTYNNLHEEVIGNLRDLGLLRPQRQIPGPQPSVSPDAGGQVRGRRKRCSRKRKRGKRAGVRARLNANPSRPALPSILLSNVCSLDNKLDYIRLQRTTRREFRDCCIFVFTETWLSDRVPEAAIQLDGLTVFRADRNAALCGKTRGGGVCVYINTEWCKNSVLVSRFCSSLVEFVTVRCRPFYLPREFTTVFIVGVYIPPSANAKEALCELYGAISDLQNAHPDGLFIIAGDFNHANLRTVLPKLHQHVDFATRGGNTLDLVYTNIPGAYRADPRPHLGYSDHISVMLIPAYRPLVRRSKPVLKQVKTLPAGATSALQDCFECTDWDMFREAATNGDSINLEEYTSTVTSYISKCVDDVTISKPSLHAPTGSRG